MNASNKSLYIACSLAIMTFSSQGAETPSNLDRFLTATDYASAVLGCAGALYSLSAIPKLLAEKPLPENASVEQKLEAYNRRIQLEQKVWRGIGLYLTSIVLNCLVGGIKGGRFGAKAAAKFASSK